MACRMLNISTGAAIAIHAARLLAQEEGSIGAQEMSKRLGVSKNHLSKIMSRLVAMGIVSSEKGPTGGFFLSDEQKENTFMDVFKAIDGSLPLCDCMFETPNCDKKNCIFGDLIRRTYSDFERTLSQTKISPQNKQK